MDADPPSWLRFRDETTATLQLAIQPGTKKTEIVGIFDECLKIKIAAPPVDGAANKVLIKFIAEELMLKKQDVILEMGMSGRRKVIAVRNLTPFALAVLDTWQHDAQK